jgi:hypothetical protein
LADRDGWGSAWYSFRFRAAPGVSSTWYVSPGL